MHLVDEHLNYNIWYCSRCDWTEIRWKEADGEYLRRELELGASEEAVFRCYLGDVIDEAVNKETKGILPLTITKF